MDNDIHVNETERNDPMGPLKDLVASGGLPEANAHYVIAGLNRAKQIIGAHHSYFGPIIDAIDAEIAALAPPTDNAARVEGLRELAQAVIEASNSGSRNFYKAVEMARAALERGKD